MGFQKGKLKLSMYRIDDNPHNGAIELIEAAAKKAAIPISDVKTTPDGVSIGFASGKILLDSQITEGNSLIDGYAVLNVRSTAKKIDAGLLKAVIQREEAAYRKANNSEFVPKKARRQIKEESVERLMADATLAVKGTELVFDGDRILIGATSDKECDTAVMLVAKDLGIVPEIPKHSNADGDEFTAGREFLTWLFNAIQSDDLPGDDNQMMIEGPLELLAPSEREDGKTGICTKAKIEGDTVANSAELETMFREKKMIRKAKLALVRDERVWRFTFDADAWNFGSLELPEDCETFADRVEAVREMYDALDGLFNAWRTAEAIARGIQELPNMEKK